ncbi:hypothetical protein [Bradyrhizobium sp.]|jgi:hypothetical protein|uniref:hypothetical protein n=1 Tax=Bradyrhizobium sp. TaxID=376 RepID=UPI003C1673E0
MTIEILIYPTLVFLAVTLTAKLIERQSDVLYGPYIQGRRTAVAEARDQLDAFLVAIGVKREYSRLAMKFATVSIFASAIMG